MELTLDLEWTKKLKDAGIGKAWTYAWIRNAFGEWRVATQNNISINEEYYPTYTLEELLAMVKGDWKLHKTTGDYTFGCKKGIYISEIDPKIAVVEALIWQKGEGR